MAMKHLLMDRNVNVNYIHINVLKATQILMVCISYTLNTILDSTYEMYLFKYSVVCPSYTCAYGPILVILCTCMYVYMYVCMYVCILCMYVSMYAYIYIFV